MKLRVFILSIILLATLGFCIVHESMRQTICRYELAELATIEKKLRQDLDKALAVEISLLSPERLEKIVSTQPNNYTAILPMPDNLKQQLFLANSKPNAYRP